MFAVFRKLLQSRRDSQERAGTELLCPGDSCFWCHSHWSQVTGFPFQYNSTAVLKGVEVHFTIQESWLSHSKKPRGISSKTLAIFVNSYKSNQCKRQFFCIMEITIPRWSCVHKTFRIIITTLAGIWHGVSGQHDHILLYNNFLWCETDRNSLNCLGQVCL